MTPPPPRKSALPRLIRAAQALARDRSGVAFVEMALLTPVLFLMYTGAYVVSDMVTCGRKVSLTARTITDLTSQYGSVSSANLTAVLSNSAYVLAPYNSANAGLRISELQVTDASHAKVVWSKGQNATALAVNAVVTLPTNLAPSLMIPSNANNQTGAFIIMGEISYAYTPAFGGGWIPSPALYNRYFMLPRLSTAIPLTS
ncbi:TadE/TadG family type IV pilus assembly protein [Novosphingobium sp.]|uniref:TadE/TadG family type IV pilus assembly protein n=1 Tax=Novosphingobium sp. TaxID=1874826 RepID=UPI0033413A00